MSNRIRRHPSRFKCSFPGCPQLGYTRKANLEEHIRACHSGLEDSWWGCFVCQALFKRRSDLVRHVRLQHRESPKYVCGELPEHDHFGCGKDFRRRDGLLQHRRARDGHCTRIPWEGGEREEQETISVEDTESMSAEQTEPITPLPQQPSNPTVPAPSSEQKDDRPPLYVNAKQYKRILKRRIERQKLEERLEAQRKVH